MACRLRVLLLLLFACASVRAWPLSPKGRSNPPVTDIDSGDHDAGAECGGAFDYRLPAAPQAPRQVAGGMHTQATYVPMKFEIDLSPSLSTAYTCQSVGQSITLPSIFIGSYRCNSATSASCVVTCTAGDVVDDAKRAAALKLIQQSTDWFSNALQVDASATTFTTPTQVPCAGWNYNTSAHFKIFVFLAPMCGSQSASSSIQGCASKTLLGQASACSANTAVTKGRPLSAVVFLSVNLFQSVNPALVTHELTHALGFNSQTALSFGAVNIQLSNRATYDSSSQYFYYTQDVPLAAGDTSTTGTLSLPATSFPTVAAQLRLHLGCAASTLPDSKLFIPWENQGTGGSRNTHWETRVFGNEFMVAALPSGTIVQSRMTLAYLHDTKWYSVSPASMSAYGEELQWGKGLGCGFLTGKCSDWVTGGMAAFAASADDKQSLNAYQNTLFCNKDYSSTPDDCTYDGSAIGTCSLRTYVSDISPSMFQYAALGARKGGDSSWSDYCPFVSGFSGTACTVDDASRYKYNPDLIPFGNVGGPTNVCIRGTLTMPAYEPYTAVSCMFANCVNPTTLALYSVETGDWSLCERQPDGSYMAFKSGSGSWKEVRCPWPKYACGANALKKAMPVITSVFPTRGPAYGGHPITLTGSNFMKYFVGAPDVGFLEALGISFPLSQVEVVSPSVIVGRTGDLSQTATSSSNIFVSWNDPYQRKVVSSTPYFIDMNWPRVTSIEPSSGQSDGGDTITLKGTNFPLSKVSGNYVKFSNAKQVEFTIVSSKQITVRRTVAARCTCLLHPPLTRTIAVGVARAGRHWSQRRQRRRERGGELRGRPNCVRRHAVRVHLRGRVLLQEHDHQVWPTPSCASCLPLRRLIQYPRYWWAALIIALIFVVILFYLGFRCNPHPSPFPLAAPPNSPPPPPSDTFYGAGRCRQK